MPSGRGLTVKGELAASEDVTIDFALEGAIIVSGHRLTVAEGGQVHASVTASLVTVHGRIDGHISADRVELGPTAHVAASIVSPRVSVEDGAHLSGQVNTERAQAAGSVARHRQKAASEP